MTFREEEEITDMYNRHGWNCFVCGERANQRSHLIGNTLLNQKLYGKRIIDNPLNWLPACSLACNKKLDIGRNTPLAKGIIRIIDDLNDNKHERIEKLIKDRL